MLYGYPVGATSGNWLHDSICEAVRTIHAHLATGKRVPPWPSILPAAHRSVLSSRTGLRDRLKAYARAVSKLSPNDRDRILGALGDENRIAELLSGACDCASIDDLPELVRAPTLDLFSFAFELLKELGIRDAHYALIYKASRDHVCPFCGTECFDAPGARREALDHYLVKNKYPFAAINLRNLVPMGSKCNSGYKLAQDILRKIDGTRRKSFDPYAHGGISVSLDMSKPFEGKDGRLPKWEIDFAPKTEQVDTWDEVFCVRERYRRDILDENFDSWLRDFMAWCKSAAVSAASNANVVDALARYTGYLESMGFRERAFLKAAMFRMLCEHCQGGHQRLLRLLMDAINSANPRKSNA